MAAWSADVQNAAGRSPEQVAALVGRLRGLRDGPRELGRVVTLGPVAVPALEALLRGPSESIPEPRCLAADALALIGGAAAVDALLRALVDSLRRELDPVLRQAESAVVNRIAEHLGWVDDPRVADLLLEALAARPYAGCARALGRLRDRRAIPLLAECLHDDFARDAAAEALRRFGREALPELSRVLLRPRREHGIEGASRIAGRAAAAALLGEIGGCETDLPLLWALLDKEKAVRRAAAAALVEAGDPEAAAVALPVLIEALGDADWARAESAADALTRLGSGAADALLAAVVADAADPEARRRRLRAVELLGRLRVPRAAGPLAALASAGDAQLRLAAVGALAHAGGEPAADALARFLDDPEAAIRLRAVQALGSHSATAARALVRVLGDPDAGVRAAAMGALQRMGEDAAPSLREVARGALRVPGGWRAQRRARQAARRLLRRHVLASRCARQPT